MAEPEVIPPANATSGTVPNQPIANPAFKKSMPVVFGLGGVILIIGLANAGHFSSNVKPPAKSSLTARPATPNAQQVSTFEKQQELMAQKDQEDRQRQAQLAAQLSQLQQEQATPGPEYAGAAPMTPAQKQAIYGESPNAPKKTSNVSQAGAEAKQRQLAREKEHQDAVNSDTVAIDFARSNGAAPATQPQATSQRTDVLGNRSEETSQAHGEDIASSSGAPGAGASRQAAAALTPVSDQRSAPSRTNTDPMAGYPFDVYQGRTYRVFEGTVFEGVVTNHIDGALAGPIIVMLTTDYYSHDHQQLLLPQGTRLLGDVKSVSSSQQRKLMVVFNRAVCPDGFSINLNSFTGLDPIGTTGLATNVNNHYLSSFAAAALIGGIGGLAQIGNTGSVLTADAEIRNGISEQTAQESEQILNKFLNRLPTITVKEGSRARVYINRDLLIPSYAEHSVDPTL